MKCTVIIDEKREEEVIVYLHSKTPIADGIRELCLADERTITAYSEDGAVKLSPGEVYAFTVSGGKLTAVTEKEKLRVRERLYEIEAAVGNSFVRINQSCIINISLVKRFRTSFGASLLVEMKNGFCDYVSRRQIKAVKERLGL